VIGAKNEWQALQQCQALGIKTTPLVGYGESGLNPAKQRSFVLTQPLENMQNLEEVMHEGRLSSSDKRKIIYQLAQIVRTFHQAGMCHRDMYLCHFLLSSEQSLQLYIIDLHRVVIRDKISKRDEIKDLAALFYSSFDMGITLRDYFYFLKIYKNQSLKEIMSDPSIKLIVKRAQAIYIKDKGSDRVK
jgi:serine/threonine protein kinase